MKPTDRSGKVLKTLGINLVLLLLTSVWVVGYLALEVHESIRSAIWPPGSFVYDPDAGFTFSEHAPFPARVAGYSVRLDPLGFRNPLDSAQAEAREGGVLGVGSSNTFGVDVECEQTYLARVAQKLARPGYNYGVPSYGYGGTLQRLHALQKGGLLARLRPSVVVMDLGPNQEAFAFTPIQTPSTLYGGNPYIAHIEKGLGVVQAPDSISMRGYLGLIDRYRIARGERPDMSWDRLQALFGFAPQMLAARAVGAYPALLNLISGKSLVASNDSPEDRLALYRYIFGELRNIFPDPGVELFAVWVPFFEGGGVPSYVAEAAKESGRVNLIDGYEAIRAAGIAPSEYSGIHPRQAVHEALSAALLGRIKNRGHAL